MTDKTVVWITDVHLDYVGHQSIERFIASIRDESPDVLLVGGDIGESPDFSAYLERLEESLDTQIYFVLGNHDFYGSSISRVREEAREISSESDKLFFLDDIPYVELTEDVALVGHSGWADGRLGDFYKSPLHITIKDYHLIRELYRLPRSQLLLKLQELGDEAASVLKEDMEAAFENYKNLICLTHVPPFREASIYDGKISDDNYLPHFASKVMGDAMREIMEARPDSQLTVLCGHTHGVGRVNILDNLEVITGGAEYRKPKIQKVMHF